MKKLDEIRDLQEYFLGGKNTGVHPTSAFMPVYLANSAGEDPMESEIVNNAEYISKEEVFPLLQWQFEQGNSRYAAFLQKIKQTITALEGILRLEDGTSGQLIGQLDFAEDLIAFDKIRTIAIDTVSSHLSEARIKRIHWALGILAKAKTMYSRQELTVFTTEKIKNSFNLDKVLRSFQLRLVAGQACEQAKAYAKEQLQEFVKTVAALKIGRLMTEQQYEEELHDHYFDNFDLAHLSEKDLMHLLPVIVVQESQQLMQESNDFLALLTNNSFVKILGINYVEDLYKIQDEEESNYLELAALAIVRRNSYFYQGAVDQPEELAKAFQNGLEFPGAVCWNILLPEEATDKRIVKAAVDSRYFPIIEYQPEANHFAFQQICLDKNLSPGSAFAEVPITIVDYLSGYPELRSSLQVVPPEYPAEALLPAPEYFLADLEEVTGKVPFIWMSTSQEERIKVAIPRDWVQKAKGRLEYWRFLQSMAGINKEHLQTTIESERSAWENAKNQEIAALTAELKTQFETEKGEILQEGLTKMLYGLIYEDNLEAFLTKVSQPSFAEEETSIDVGVPNEVTETIKAPELLTAQPVQEEAWVESDECTSCKDCIVAVPTVFKYNENKQAYVYNPEGGTFAQIVSAAEKCPSRCIHPGRPQNKKEADLAKWMKRAEKFE